MFLHQAALQYELCTGRPPVRTLMEQLLREALDDPLPPHPDEGTS